jgi:hypothetical protein
MVPVRVLLYRVAVVWSLDFAFICSVWDIIEAARPGTMRYPTPDLRTIAAVALFLAVSAVGAWGMGTNWRR